jgi:hypothetical protein
MLSILYKMEPQKDSTINEEIIISNTYLEDKVLYEADQDDGFKKRINNKDTILLVEITKKDYDRCMVLGERDLKHRMRTAKVTTADELRLGKPTLKIVGYCKPV